MFQHLKDLCKSKYGETKEKTQKISKSFSPFIFPTMLIDLGFHLLLHLVLDGGLLNIGTKFFPTDPTCQLLLWSGCRLPLPFHDIKDNEDDKESDQEQGRQESRRT